MAEKVTRKLRAIFSADVNVKGYRMRIHLIIVMPILPKSCIGLHVKEAGESHALCLRTPSA